MPNLLRWPVSTRRHEAVPVAKDGLLEDFLSKAMWEEVWLSAMLAGRFLDTMAGVFFFHLIRKCNTSSKQFSPNWSEMLKYNPKKIPLPLSQRCTLLHCWVSCKICHYHTKVSDMFASPIYFVFKNKTKIHNYYIPLGP